MLSSAQLYGVWLVPGRCEVSEFIPFYPLGRAGISRGFRAGSSATAPGLFLALLGLVAKKLAPGN